MVENFSYSRLKQSPTLCLFIVGLAFITTRVVSKVSIQSLCDEEYDENYVRDEQLALENYDYDDDYEDYSQLFKDKQERRFVNSRIFEGRRARPGEFPYHVRLDRNNKFLCNGAIIDERHILTAAHCVENLGRVFQASELSVFVGDLNIREVDGEIFYQVEKIIVHSEYSSMSNDICIIKIIGTFRFQQHQGGFGSVQPVCTFNERNPLKPGDMLTVSGWGQLANTPGNPMMPDHLMTLDVPFVQFDSCKKTLAQISLFVGPGDVCAGYENGDQRVCHGDSGGPLVRRNGACAELVGVVSKGHAACVGSPLATYASAVYHREWIIATTRE